MRFPRASAVIVALSTLVAVTTVAALVSQLSPLDRAGAALPQGPITTTAQPVDPESAEEPAPATESPSTSAGSTSGGSTGDPTSQQPASGIVTVVAPVTAEPVPAEPVPTEPASGEPEPTSPPAPGGHGGGAPDEAPGNSAHAPGQNKP